LDKKMKDLYFIFIHILVILSIVISFGLKVIDKSPIDFDSLLIVYFLIFIPLHIIYLNQNQSRSNNSHKITSKGKSSNGHWQCPNCKTVIPNDIYICPKCEYKLE